MKIVSVNCPKCNSDYLKYPHKNICPKCEHDERIKVSKEYYEMSLKK